MSHQPRTAAKPAAPALVGKAIAAALAAAGANVVINHNHTPDLAGTVVAASKRPAGQRSVSPPTSPAGPSTRP
jgi:NAD(P)-dependent dehydrogenase (short-subunit alcohol dehydrogenase family)